MQLTGYADLRLMGSGGLGDVYRATKSSTGATVAIKALRDLTDSSRSWHRARRELEALSSLKGHPHVVQIVEIIEHDGMPLLVMEYAAGGSIDDLLAERGGRLSTAETVLVGAQVADALESAHRLGVIHRDIKPQNILIGTFGQAKVCDFGIASIAASERFGDVTRSVSYRYAAPEELDGDRTPTPASDIYSLGATLAHCMQGFPPRFSERTFDPPPGSPSADGDTPVDPTVFGELTVLVRRCLSADPAARPTAADVAERLEQLGRRLGASRVRSLRPPTGAEVGTVPVSPEPSRAEPNQLIARPPRLEVPNGDPPSRSRPWHPALVVAAAALVLGVSVAAWSWRGLAEGGSDGAAPAAEIAVLGVSTSIPPSPSTTEVAMVVPGSPDVEVAEVDDYRYLSTSVDLRGVFAGACFDDASPGTEVLTASLVSCVAPHRFQLFHRGTLPEAVVSAEDPALDSICDDQLVEFAGVEAAASALWGIVQVIDLSESRELSCVMYLSNFVVWTGSAEAR